MTATMTGSRRLAKGIGNTALALMVFWTAVPFYWMIVTSLKHDKEIYGYEATLIPSSRPSPTISPLSGIPPISSISATAWWWR